MKLRGGKKDNIYFDSEESMNNRDHSRMSVQGLSADVSDGAGFFPGVVSDVSRFGMRMDDLPKRLDSAAKKMTIVVSGYGKNFKMVVKPRWCKETSLRKIVGFEVVNTPWEWTDFVMKFEPQKEEDVWDVVNI